MINITMYKASEGDSFLISFGENKDINIIIDMGLSETYQEHIKKDLLELNKNNRRIQLLVVTHIDKDHIEGAVSFLEENGNNSKIIKVDEVWHNSYKHLQFDKQKVNNIEDEETKALSLIKYQNSNNLKEDGISDTSVKEGVTLASLIYENKYKWNNMFNNRAICIEEEINNTINDVTFILLSPNYKKLRKLSKKWEDKLDSVFYNFKLSEEVIFDDAFELYMQNLNESEVELKDTSSSNDVFDIDKLAMNDETEYAAANGSSISFIIEYKEKKMLFLADSQSDIIFQNLNKLKNDGYQMDFDIVKISHHGSNKNTSMKLLNLFDSKKYLISTDGKKNSHPNLEVIAKIIKKESKHTKEIIFNYEHPKLEPFQSSSLKEKYNYSIIVQNEIIIH